MITKEEYEKAKEQKLEIEKLISNYHKQKEQEFLERWKKFEDCELFFTDDELKYSAHVICKICGAGMAYPKECMPNHKWSCSAQLKGEHQEKHTELSFMFYEIKSETMGYTTRPKKD